MHSTTKYFSGHSDVLGGAVVAKEEGELFGRVRAVQTAEGAVPSPFDCWLTLRGVAHAALPDARPLRQRGAGRRSFLS